MNGPSLKTVIPYMVIGALIALGLGAAVVRALDWEGDWEVGVLVAAAVGAAGWKVWTDIVKPWRLERNAETAESRHSQAVGLSLRRRGNPKCLAPTSWCESHTSPQPEACELACLKSPKETRLRELPGI